MNKQLLKRILTTLSVRFNHRIVASFAVISVAFSLTACEEAPIPHSAEKIYTPVQYIAHLAPEQQADGILVKFSSSANSGSRSRSLNAAGLTERVEQGQFGLVPGLTLTEVSPGLDINTALNALAGDPNIAYAEPNYIYTINATPNDPDYNQQWGLNNSSNTDINAPEAWDTGTGSNSVVIAVIDSGVDYNHPDLRNRIWNNPGEIAGNNRDDDGNGFIDDVRGWDFESNDNNPMDENNHGTHVAGIIGAEANNGRGTSGVNWNVQIMPLKFMNPQGAGTTAAAIQAIDYAVRNGARVSNNSWGGGSFSQALFDAIQRANTQGHMFMAAAGNDGLNNDNSTHYPSSYNLPNIISVASVDQNGRLSSFSNFGRNTVDIAAPGGQIYSTIRNGGYQSFSGTSMATPFVSGVAGLLLAQNPNLTVNEIRNALLNNVTPVAALANNIGSGGRLNAQAAITSISSTAPGAPTAVEITPPGINSLAVGDTLQLNASGGSGIYTWQTNNSAIATVSNNGLLTALALGTVRVTAQDSSGITSNALTLTVSAGGNQSLTISPTNLVEIELNASQQFNVSGGTGPYSWRINNTSVASVLTAASGRSATVTANRAGTFFLSISDVNGAATTSPIISVISNALNINAPKTSLNIGETVQLIASGGTSPYVWSSTNQNVATVDSGGLVSAIGAGFSSIALRDTTGNQVSVNFEIINNTPGEIVITPSNSAVSVGTTTRLKVTGGGLQINWVSSNSAVANIDTRGVVKALTPGITTITATDELGNTGQTNFEVREISISASVLTIGAGDTLQMTADGGTNPYDWSVSNPSLASIDQNGLLSTNLGSTGGILVTATDKDGIAKSIIVTINNSTTLRTPTAR